MIKKIISISSCLCLWSSLYAEEIDPDTQDDDAALVPPKIIAQQLLSAEEQYKIAKEMFNPWYAGPLITPSAHIIPPGLFNIQPYVFFTNNFAEYDEHGDSHSIPHLHQIKPLVAFQFGILKKVDGILVAQGLRSQQQGHHSAHIGDTSLSLGYGILSETTYRPALLFGVQETFPTGKYQRLSPNKGGIDATGAGSYQTTFNFNVSKVVWWWSLHPMQLRLFLGYTIPARVKVHGFNAYGGGFKTNGTVDPGNNFSVDIGYEYSFTQRWVFALDTVYTYTWKTTFSGRPGFTAKGPGAPLASVGAPFNDQLSFAPAIEYNPNADLGLLFGVWFSVWGRNSLDFVAEVISFTKTF